MEDFERVRAIYELAVQQSLDMPEIVWKAYIDFEVGEGERERARNLYERLLERTTHVKVFISYALMEMSTLGGGEDEEGNEIEGEGGDSDLARSVFRRGYKDLRTRGEKEDVSGHRFRGRAELTSSEHCCWKLGSLSRRSMVHPMTLLLWRK